MISGKSPEYFLSFVWLDVFPKEINDLWKISEYFLSFVWLDVFPKEINDLWKFFQANKWKWNSSNQTSFHLFDWDWDLFPLKQFERNYFFKININTVLILKKSVCPKFPFKITSHQNFLSSAPLTKSGSFAALILIKIMYSNE